MRLPGNLSAAPSFPSHMTPDLRARLVAVMNERQTKDDPSHDHSHIRRVLSLAEKIGAVEGADMDILVPAALFHDIVVYRKNDPRSAGETDESAGVAAEVLSGIPEYPQEKIPAVQTCIRECSFTKGLPPSILESKVLQDADKLESTGAVSIMRTFSSGGQMNRQFYPPEDPLAEKDVVKSRSGIDLFRSRLLVVEEKMHTASAKEMAKRRTEFLRQFLDEFRIELEESGQL